MDCAFICDKEDYFLNRIFAGVQKPRMMEPYHLNLIKNEVSILPIASANKSRQLDQSIFLAVREKCGHIAMSPQKAALVSTAVKKNNAVNISDGRLYAIATMPALLDQSIDNWQKMNLCIQVEDAFMALAARIAAKRVGRLHLVGNNILKMQALAQLIYEESGLICPISKIFPKGDHLFLLPPQGNHPENLKKLRTDQQIWNQWANAAYLGQETAQPANNTNKRRPSLPASLTQSVLFYLLTKTKKSTLPNNWPDTLFLLAKKGEYYGLQPVSL